MFKPLLRTIPTMSGNVKLACSLSDYDKIDTNIYECNVRGARLLPLNSKLAQYNIVANLISSTWDFDIRKYYDKYSNIFFDDGFNINENEIFVIDKTSRNDIRNTDFEFGVKRVSYIKNDAEFAFFAPIYIESIDDIPEYFYINIYFTGANKGIEKTIKVNINADNSKNYLKEYLNRYAKTISDNVIFLNNEGMSATYFGIDLLNGGQTKKVDSRIKNIYIAQLPIQELDYMITSGFKRNKMAASQVIPLCYYIDIEKILTDKEKELLIGSDVKFEGYYYNSNGIKCPFYDYSFDYDYYIEDILRMDETTGILRYTKGYSENIMNEPFPGMYDKNIIKYQFSNKLTANYNRWKLKYSTDKHPYIINFAWGFSHNQDNNYKYKEFPTIYTSQTGICTIESETDKNLRKSYHYNLIFPLGEDNISIYDKYNTLSADKYKNIINNYCLNWFNVVKWNSTSPIEDIINSQWVKVSDAKAYYNGILYNIKNIYDKSIVQPENKLDYFGVFAYIDTTDIKGSTDIEKLKFSDYTFVDKNSGFGLSSTNCNINTALISSSSKNAYLYNLDSVLYNDSVKYNNIFKELPREEAIGLDGSYFIELSYLNGFDYYELNKYYYKDDADKILSQSNAYIDYYKNYNSYSPQFITNSIYNGLTQELSNEDAAYCISYINNIRDVASNIVFNTPLELKLIHGIEQLDIYKSSSTTSGSYEGNSITFINKDKLFDSSYISQGYYVLNELGYELASGLVTNDNYNNYSLSCTDKSAFLGKKYSPVEFNSFDFKVEDASLSYTAYKNMLYEKKDFVNANNIYEMYDESVIGFRTAAPINYDRKKINTPYTKEWVDYQLYKGIIRGFGEVTTSYINTMNLPEYEYYIDLQDQKSSYSKYVFKKRNYLGRKYENNTSINNIKKDKNVLYVSKYNINRLVTHYKDYKEIKPLIDDIDNVKRLIKENKEQFYSRIINKPYIKMWYEELYKDEDLKGVDNWESEWKNRIYIQEKVLVNTGDRKLETKYKYIPISKLTFKDIEGNEYKISEFSSFFENLDYITEDKCFKFVNAPIYKENGVNIRYDEFDLYIKDEYVRMDEILWTIMNINPKESPSNVDPEETKSLMDAFKDFYIYRSYSPVEYDNKFWTKRETTDASGKIINSPIYDKPIEYITNSVDDYEIVDVYNALYPLYNEYFAQDKEDTIIDEVFILGNINESGMNFVNYDGTTAEKYYRNYRYNVNDTVAMIGVGNNTSIMDHARENIAKLYNYINSIDEVIDQHIKVYSNYSDKQRCVLNTDNLRSDLGYDNSCKLNIVQYGGKTYGYYLIDVLLDNTYDTFNIRGMLSNTHISISEEIENNSLKYIEYVNGVNITKNRDYLSTIFKQLCQFLYIQPLRLIVDLNTIYKPYIINLNTIYEESLKNNTNKSSELDINIGGNNYIQQKMVLQRYTDSIVPYLYEVSNIKDLYYLKYKDVNKVLLDSGEYNSIGDSIIYKIENNTLKSYPGIKIYTPVPTDWNNDGENPTIPITAYPQEFDHPELKTYKDYNCHYTERYFPIEYKYYNGSKAVYLPIVMEKWLDSYYTYDELHTLESETETIIAFRSLISKYIQFNDSELLFLYKQYNVEYDKVPVKLDIYGTTKLYTFKYKFNLL